MFCMYSTVFDEAFELLVAYWGHLPGNGWLVVGPGTTGDLGASAGTILLTIIHPKFLFDEKFVFVVIPYWVIRSLQIFAHATTAVLS